MESYIVTPDTRGNAANVNPDLVDYGRCTTSNLTTLLNSLKKISNPANQLKSCINEFCEEFRNKVINGLNKMRSYFTSSSQTLSNSDKTTRLKFMSQPTANPVLSNANGHDKPEVGLVASRVAQFEAYAGAQASYSRAPIRTGAAKPVETLRNEFEMARGERGILNKPTIKTGALATVAELRQNYALKAGIVAR